MHACSGDGTHDRFKLGREVLEAKGGALEQLGRKLGEELIRERRRDRLDAAKVDYGLALRCRSDNALTQASSVKPTGENRADFVSEL